MIDDWENKNLCSEDNINPVADRLISLQSIYNKCSEGNKMIDDDATFKQFGYTSKDLKHKSNKMIFAVCNDCGFKRTMELATHLRTNGRCKPCSMKGENNPFYKKNTF